MITGCPPIRDLNNFSQAALWMIVHPSRIAAVALRRVGNASHSSSKISCGVQVPSRNWNVYVISRCASCTTQNRYFPLIRNIKCAPQMCYGSSHKVTGQSTRQQILNGAVAKNHDAANGDCVSFPTENKLICTLTANAMHATARAHTPRLPLFSSCSHDSCSKQSCMHISLHNSTLSGRRKYLWNSCAAWNRVWGELVSWS